jgi:hypothetical protein
MQNRQGPTVSKVERVLHSRDFGERPQQATDQLAVRALIDLHAGCADRRDAILGAATLATAAAESNVGRVEGGCR